MLGLRASYASWVRIDLLDTSGQVLGRSGHRRRKARVNSDVPVRTITSAVLAANGVVMLACCRAGSCWPWRPSGLESRTSRYSFIKCRTTVMLIDVSRDFLKQKNHTDGVFHGI